MGDGEDNGGGGDGGEEVYNESVEPVLVSLSDLYSDEDRFLVGDNRPSSCPVHTVYWLLSLPTTALRKVYTILV